jgi:hypothetical protein
MAHVEQITEGTSSPQDLTWIYFMRAMVAFAEGRLLDARSHARESRDVYFGSDSPFAAGLAAHIDILLEDTDGLAQDRVYLAQNFMFGRWIEGVLNGADAALSAMSGDTDQARASYRRVMESWRDQGNNLELALTLLERSRLLTAGPEQAAKDRSQAQELFTAMGAADFIARLESVAGASVSAVLPTTPTSIPRPGDAAAAKR